MLIENVYKEKEKINYIISNSIQEILKKGLRVAEKSLGSLEDDIGIMLRALQLKNKIYDYVVFIKYNELFKRFEGKVVYSLINTGKMDAKEAKQWEIELEFFF